MQLRRAIRPRRRGDLHDVHELRKPERVVVHPARAHSLVYEFLNLRARHLIAQDTEHVAQVTLAHPPRPARVQQVERAL